ncbi:hypothetical protein BDW62DRAFT_202621 [Aspergillus aurantiobrunneus]
MELAEQGQSASNDAAFSHNREAGSDIRSRHILLDADEFATKYELDDIRREIRAGDSPNGHQAVHTKGLALEEIAATFDVSIIDRAAYRLHVHVPYMFRRFILWRNVELEPFEESRYYRGAVRLEGDGFSAVGAENA